MRQYYAESNQVSDWLNELVVFNDPDDDRFDDEPLCVGYLGDEFIDKYVIYRNIANGDPATYIDLYYNMSRVEMIRIYAMNLTFIKEKNKASKHGR